MRVVDLRLLIVEDSDDDAELIVAELRRSGFAVIYRRIETAESLSAALDSGEFDLIISDFSLPQFSAPRALEIVKARKIDIPFIIVSGIVTEQTVLQAMKAGASDYVMKNNLIRLGAAVERELAETRVRRQAAADREQAEAVRAQLAAIVESSQDAIIGKSLEGIVQSWNAGAERVYGYTASEMIGHSMRILAPPDRLNEEPAILRRISAGDHVESFETVRVRKDGKTIHVSLTISPVRDLSGRITGASHIARDITERKQFDEQLRQTQRLESLGVLAGGVAHDFNNLLVGILGNASLALEKISPISPLRTPLKDVVVASERAAALTQQLLAYAGKGRFEVRLIDISTLIVEISSLVRTSIPKTVQLRLELQDNLPLIEGDPSQLQQLVMNLVINGAEAVAAKGPDGAGTVLITTGPQEVDENYIRQTFADHPLPAGKYVAVEVHDTGIGIADATIARIFDPFFTTKFTGRGLGLSAALGIVRGHRGAMKVYSKPREGSTFKVLLPATEKQRTATEDEPAAEDLSGSATILVIDDEETVRRTSRTALERYGYHVFTADDGKQGIDLLLAYKDQIALVLLDMTMPVTSGEETFRQIKQIRPDIRVILSSGFNEVEAVRRFTGKGLGGFLQKPYTARKLAEKVKSVLNSPSEV